MKDIKSLMSLLVGILITVLLTAFLIHPDFLTKQMKYNKVRSAMKDKGAVVKQNLISKGVNIESIRIIVVVYKKENKLHVYARNLQENSHKIIANYNICYMSGYSGPKRKQGDFQVPEGFYHVNVFNPTSDYYLSLGINYPNESDLIKTTSRDPGGNIFIHGDCVSIGCIAMTDEIIKELYIYAMYAKNYGQKTIPVYIFPFMMTKQKMQWYITGNKKDTTLCYFWNNLKIGYDLFHKDKKALKIVVNQKGDYTF